MNLNEFINYYRESKFSEALSILNKIENQGTSHPAILVWKSRCIQLSEDLLGHDLSEVEKLLLEALKLDGDYTPALIDLAYLYSRILDENQKAIPIFRKALDNCRKEMTEIIVGLGETIADTESNDAALIFLSNINDLIIDGNEIEKFKAELN